MKRQQKNSMISVVMGRYWTVQDMFPIFYVFGTNFITITRVRVQRGVRFHHSCTDPFKIKYFRQVEIKILMNLYNNHNLMLYIIQNKLNGYLLKIFNMLFTLL